jgi:hypothetical protein
VSGQFDRLHSFIGLSNDVGRRECPNWKVGIVTHISGMRLAGCRLAPPTALVRDGDLENHDIPPSGPFLMTPVKCERTVENVYGSRRVRWVVPVAMGGVLAIVGLYLLLTPGLVSHRFSPSLAQQSVMRTGGTGIPPSCSPAQASSASSAGILQIVPLDADTEYTVYPHSEFVIVETGSSSAELSKNAPVCSLGGLGGSGSNETTYAVVRPGTVTIYFVDGSARVSVAELKVSSWWLTPSLIGWVLIAVGLVLIAWGAVAFIRISISRPADDPLRA